MNLTLGFSPCPNDTFMFEAIINHRIDLEGIKFNVSIDDVSQLNKWSFDGRLDVTKLSFNAFKYCVKNYALLDSGSAIGRNCGPLLIKKPKTKLTSQSSIAIPGKYTTANMLLESAFPQFLNKHEVLFSEIEELVLNNKIDAGLIIHENRFTYKDKGLEKVIDLGEFWETKYSLPIPLGGIVVKRDLHKEIQQKVNRVLKRSIEFALLNPEVSNSYVRLNAQELEQEVINSHIDLYVNDFTVSLGSEGRNAVEKIFENISSKKKPLFV